MTDHDNSSDYALQHIDLVMWLTSATLVGYMNES